MSVHPSAITVGDVIRLAIGDHKFRVWKVVSVNLGGVGQEDVIGLEVVDRMSPTIGDVMHIPCDVLKQVPFERV